MWTWDGRFGSPARGPRAQTVRQRRSVDAGYWIRTPVSGGLACGQQVAPAARLPGSRLLDAGRDLRNTAAVIGAGEPLEPAAPSGLGGRAVHGILALGLEKTVALGIALYLPRHLGLADYGRYVFLVSYLGFFQALPDGALEAVLVARLARAAAGDGGALAGRGARGRPAVPLVGGPAGPGPLAASTLAVVGAQQILQLLLLRLHGASEVGLLGGARKLTEAIGLLPQALMLSVLPALALAAVTPAGAAGAAREAARGLVIVLLPPAAALALWAEPVLVRFFGPSFAAAAPVLRVLAPAALLGATGAVLMNLLVAVGRQRPLPRVTAGAGAGMIALGAALVPAYGALGAAAAFLAASLAGQVALLALPATRPEAAPVLAAVVPPLGLGAAAVGAAVALGASVPVGAALLLVAYPAALCLTGTVTRADLARWRA